MPSEPTPIQLQIDMSNNSWARAGRSTVGFIATREGSALSRGSGTLIRFGKISGVLTCGHVAEAVLREIEIGILSFAVRSKELQTLRVPTAAIDSVVIGSPRWIDEHGPDIGFLRLPAATIASLERLSSVTNGNLHRQNILAGVPERTRPYNVACGVIDERTGPPVVRGTVSTTPFEALLNLGNVVDVSEAAGMDLFRLQPIAGDGVLLPTDYKGASGSGLWQFYLNPDDFSLVQAQLSGVAFRQTPVGDELHIVGHGQRSVYDVLFKKIVEKWPTEAT